MKPVTPKSLNERIVDLKQQLELNESNFKYAMELQADTQSLARMKEEIGHLKEVLELLESTPQ